MGRKYRFIAVEGEADPFEPLFDLFELELDRSRPTQVLGPDELPRHHFDTLVWSHYDRGTLFDFRVLPYPYSKVADLTDRVAELARATRSKVMCTEELSTVIHDIIILVSPTGELIRRVFHSEIEPCESVGTPLFDTGEPRHEDDDWFEYAEGSPKRALEWFLGFDAYAWSDLELFDVVGLSPRTATPARWRRFRSR